MNGKEMGTLIVKPGRRGVIEFKPKFHIDQPCLICDAVAMTLEIEKECICKTCLDKTWFDARIALKDRVER
jgi:hypothetical protein